MTHYRSLLDHEFLGAWDLQRNGKPMDVTITIGAVDATRCSNHCTAARAALGGKK